METEERSLPLGVSKTKLTPQGFCAIGNEGRFRMSRTEKVKHPWSASFPNSMCTKHKMGGTNIHCALQCSNTSKMDEGQMEDSWGWREWGLQGTQGRGGQDSRSFQQQHALSAWASSFLTPSPQEDFSPILNMWHGQLRLLHLIPGHSTK